MKPFSTLPQRLLQKLLDTTVLHGRHTEDAQRLFASRLLAAHSEPHTPADATESTAVPTYTTNTPMWFGRRFFKTAAIVAIAGIANLTAYPLAIASQMPKASTYKTAPVSADRQMVELIDEVRATLMSPADSVMRKTFDPNAALTKFDALANDIEVDMHNQYDIARAAKDQTPQMLTDLAEQQKQFKERSTVFRAKLQDMIPSGLLKRSAKSDGSDLNQWLNEVSPLKAPEDLTEMPFQILKADKNNVPRDFSVGQTTPLKSGLLKAGPDFNDPQYLASVGEVEITDDIRAKAQELGMSPVKIYEWVRNNVEWQPTWGGQQTADMTLDVKRGNAMDIATLTIAILRAANIPARYIHGTIDLPAAQFKNMAGDFDNVEAAMDFASAGGIPITSIISGGQVTKIRMEHVWVEAAVPYYPARGAKPVGPNNPIDTWVPLDPSNKQYQYLAGLDTAAIANINGEQLANDFMNSGTVNEQEGWVQGLNATIVEQAQQQAQQKLEAHINSMQNPTVGDVIGGRKIVQQRFSMLPATLPYPNSVRGVTHTQLTSSLQVRVTLGLGWDRIDQDYTQKNTWPLYQLNQRNITISFKPASIADENALKAMVPVNVTDPSQLPSFLPSSIRVVPEIKRDDQILLSTNASMALGDEVDTGYHFTTPTQNYLNKKDSVIAGGYLALGIVGSNPSKKTFNNLHSSLIKTKQVLEGDDEEKISQLKKEKLLGDMFVSGIQSYYMQYIAQSKVLSTQENVNFQPVPMAGTFGFEPYTRTLFGLNRGIEEHGTYMNVRVAQTILAKNKNREENIFITLQLGVLSSELEHKIPEHLFTVSENNKPFGFSAVKSISLAAQQGQSIYGISTNNKVETIQMLHLDSLAMSEIGVSLSADKEVVTHTDRISIPGFLGSGYIIIDPETGEGSYKISGGKNGAFQVGFAAGFLAGCTLAGLDVALTIKGGKGAIRYLLIALALEIIWMATVWKIYGLLYTEMEQKCFLTGVAGGLLAIGIAAGTLLKALNLLKKFKGDPLGGTGTVFFINSLASVVLYFSPTASPWECLDDR